MKFSQLKQQLDLVSKRQHKNLNDTTNYAELIFSMFLFN